MPSSHLYPDPSDPCPKFLLGEVDLDDATPASLGEVLSRVPHEEPAKPVAHHHHPHPDTASGDAFDFMFGANPEQPAPDDLQLSLWAFAQA